jgi:hypothetical protein
MTVCAVIKRSTNIVTNLIMCESHDPAPEGFFFIADPPAFVTIGVEWNGTEFIDPSLPKKVNGLEML